MTNVRDLFIRARKVFGQLLCKLPVLFFGPKRYLETNNSEKAKFPVTKLFGLTFLVLSSVTKLRGRFIRVHKVL